MKYYFLSLVVLLAIFVVSCKKKEQDLSHSPDFNNSFSISSEFIDATSQLKIAIHLADSFHAYAPGEKIGKPIKLEITNINGWAADGAASIPPGKNKLMGELWQSIVLQGDVHISQKLKKGNGQGEALLYLQVCTANACDRPRVHRVPLISGRQENIQ
jgi:hypothetical protein